MYLLTCDDRNPPWTDEKIKKLIPHKNRAFNVYSRDKNNVGLFKNFQSLQAQSKSKTIIHAYLINY